MATKTNSKKTTSKATINLPKINISKSKNKKIKNNLNNFSAKTILIALVLLIAGLSIGAGLYFFVCRNDCFELVGEEELTFTLGESYIDEGVKIIEFNKDIKENVYIETNLKQDNNSFYADEIGTYYIKYMSNSIKYGKVFSVSKVRLITFVEESESVIYGEED